jgi:hypothetical protein
MSCLRRRGGQVHWCGRGGLGHRLEYEDGQPQTTVYGSLQFYPGRFEYSVCELELRGGDELEAGGIELSWTLDEDLDPAEYGRDDYPEADLPDYVGPDTDDH